MSKLNAFLKLLVRLVLVLLTCLVLFFNSSLYYDPDFKENKYNEDVHNQLNYLKLRLEEGAGEEMQLIFPEGFIFINVLYGLSWCKLIENQPKESELFKKGIQEVTRTINQINSPEAKNIFQEELPLKYGAFYRGWSNYLLGKKIAIQLEQDRDYKEVNLFKNNCKEISEVIKNSDSPYLESYKCQKWPADGIIAVSSLKLSDQIYEENNYGKLLKEWLEKVKTNLDEKTGLIPHSVHCRTDEIIEGARGSSQSLILNFLIDIEKSFSEDQFRKYKTHFLERRIGMPGIREYPKGIKGFGDIDSGPVIFEIGGAASIVGQRTMACYSEWSIYKQLRNSIESFGMGFTIRSKKKYLLGKLPIADAFIVWSNSIETNKIEKTRTDKWRLKIQLISLLLVLMFVFLIIKI